MGHIVIHILFGDGLFLLVLLALLIRYTLITEKKTS